MNRRWRFERTSLGERDKDEMRFECPASGLYAGNGDSDGDLGEGKRSSSRRSLRPFLKAMMGGGSESRSGCMNHPRRTDGLVTTMHGIKPLSGREGDEQAQPELGENSNDRERGRHRRGGGEGWYVPFQR